jgi:hypothetical protein
MVWGTNMMGGKGPKHFIEHIDRWRPRLTGPEVHGDIRCHHWTIWGIPVASNILNNYVCRRAFVQQDQLRGRSAFRPAGLGEVIYTIAALLYFF